MRVISLFSCSRTWKTRQFQRPSASELTFRHFLLFHVISPVLRNFFNLHIDYNTGIIKIKIYTPVGFNIPTGVLNASKGNIPTLQKSEKRKF